MTPERLALLHLELAATGEAMLTWEEFKEISNNDFHSLGVVATLRTGTPRRNPRLTLRPV